MAIPKIIAEAPTFQIIKHSNNQMSILCRKGPAQYAQRHYLVVNTQNVNSNLSTKLKNIMEKFSFSSDERKLLLGYVNSFCPAKKKPQMPISITNPDGNVRIRAARKDDGTVIMNILDMVKRRIYGTSISPYEVAAGVSESSSLQKIRELCLKAGFKPKHFEDLLNDVS